MLLGLRTVIYHAAELEKVKAWYADAFGIEPYFDEPFYVGFELGGYELGLSPDTVEAPAGAGGVVAYWAVVDADSAVGALTARGARLRSAVQDVGDGVRVAIVEDPFGNLLGLIENAPVPRDR